MFSVLVVCMQLYILSRKRCDVSFAFVLLHKSWSSVEIARNSVSKDKTLKSIAPVTKKENLWLVSSKIKNSGFIVIRYGSKELNLETFYCIPHCYSII